MKNIDKTISEILECEYVVPLYQRSFTWGEKELTQLLQDIYSSYKRDKNSITNPQQRKINGIIISQIIPFLEVQLDKDKTNKN